MLYAHVVCDLNLVSVSMLSSFSCSVSFSDSISFSFPFLFPFPVTEASGRHRFVVLGIRDLVTCWITRLDLDDGSLRKSGDDFTFVGNTSPSVVNDDDDECILKRHELNLDTNDCSGLGHLDPSPLLL